MSSASQGRRRRRTVKEWLRDNNAKMNQFLKTHRRKPADRPRGITKTVFDVLPTKWDLMLANGLYLAETHAKGLGLFCLYDIEDDVLVSEFNITGAVSFNRKLKPSPYAIAFSIRRKKFVSDPSPSIIYADKARYLTYFVNEPSENERANTIFHEMSDHGETRVFLHSCSTIPANTEIMVHYGGTYPRGYSVGQPCDVSDGQLYRTLGEFITMDQRTDTAPFPLETALGVRLFRSKRNSSFMDTVLVALFTDPCEYLSRLWASRKDRFGQAVQKLRQSLIDQSRTPWIHTSQEFQIFLAREITSPKSGDPATFLAFLLKHYQASKVKSTSWHLLSRDGRQLVGTLQVFSRTPIVFSVKAASSSFLDDDPSCIIYSVYLEKVNIKHDQSEPLNKVKQTAYKQQVLAKFQSPVSDKNAKNIWIDGRFLALDVVLRTPYHIVEIARENQISPKAHRETCQIGNISFRLHAAIVAHASHSTVDYACWFRRDEIYYAYDKDALAKIGDFRSLQHHRDTQGATLFTHSCLLFYSPITPANTNEYFTPECEEQQYHLNAEHVYAPPKESINLPPDQRQAESPPDQRRAESTPDQRQAESTSDQRRAESTPDQRRAESTPDQRRAESTPDQRQAESTPDQRQAESTPDQRQAESTPDQRPVGSAQTQTPLARRSGERRSGPRESGRRREPWDNGLSGLGNGGLFGQDDWWQPAMGDGGLFQLDNDRGLFGSDNSQLSNLGDLRQEDDWAKADRAIGEWISEASLSWPKARELGLRPPRFQSQSCYMDSVFVALFSDFKSIFLAKLWDARRDEFGTEVRLVRDAMLDTRNIHHNDSSMRFRDYIAKQNDEFRVNRTNDPEEFLVYMLARYAATSTRVTKTHKFVVQRDGFFKPIGPLVTNHGFSIVTASSPSNVFLNPGEYTCEINPLGQITTAVEPDNQSENIAREHIESFVLDKRYREQDFVRREERNVTEAIVTVETPYHIVTMYRGRWRQEAIVMGGKHHGIEAGRIDKTPRRVLELQTIGSREFRLHAAVIYQPNHYLCWFRGQDDEFYNYNDTGDDVIPIGDFASLVKYEFAHGSGEISKLETHACLLFYSPTDEDRDTIENFFSHYKDSQRELEERHRIDQEKRNRERIEPDATSPGFFQPIRIPNFFQPIRIPGLSLGLTRSSSKSFMTSVLFALASDRSEYMKGLWASRQDAFGNKVRALQNGVLEDANRFIGSMRAPQNTPLSFLRFFLGRYAASRARTLLTQYFKVVDQNQIKSVGIVQKRQSSIMTDWSALQEGNVIIHDNVSATVPGYELEGPTTTNSPKQMFKQLGKIANVNFLGVQREAKKLDGLVEVSETFDTLYHIVSIEQGKRVEISEFKPLGVFGTLSRLHATIVEYQTDRYAAWLLGNDDVYYDTHTFTRIGPFQDLYNYQNDSFSAKSRLLFYAPLHEDRQRLSSFFDQMVAPQLEMEEHERLENGSSREKARFEKDTQPLGDQVYCGKYKSDPLKVPVDKAAGTASVYAPGDWVNLRPVRRKGTLAECQTVGFNAAKAFIYKMQ